MRTDGHVVVAIDGAEHSDLTVRWGVDAARRHDAPLLLVHAHRDPRELGPWAWQAGALPETATLEAEIVAALLEVRDKVRANHPELTVDARVLAGPAAPAVREVTHDALVLVVGARSRYGRTGTGSVSSHLVTHAACPVLVVRDREPGEQAQPVVVGVDGSRTAECAARVAAREAELRGSTLRIVHARPSPQVSTWGRDAAEAPPEEPVRAAAWALAEQVVAEHPRVHVELVLCDDSPVHALVDESRDADLVVVGSRGLGVFRGMLLGSVSREVVRQAASSVLVVRDGTD